METLQSLLMDQQNTQVDSWEYEMQNFVSNIQALDNDIEWGYLQ